MTINWPSTASSSALANNINGKAAPVLPSLPKRGSCTCSAENPNWRTNWAWRRPSDAYNASFPTSRTEIPSFSMNPVTASPKIRSKPSSIAKRSSQERTKESPALRQVSIMFSVMVYDPWCLAITPSWDTTKAAAPSPELRSASPLGAPWRQSLAITSTFLAEPATTESKADISAVVPARSTSVISAAKMSRRRSNAAAIIEAHCFSAYGGVVVANRSPSISWRARPFRQSMPAATAMLTLSSSKLATERSPEKFQPSVVPPNRYRGT